LQPLLQAPRRDPALVAAHQFHPRSIVLHVLLQVVNSTVDGEVIERHSESQSGSGLRVRVPGAQSKNGWHTHSCSVFALLPADGAIRYGFSERGRRRPAGSGARVVEEAALEMPYAGNCIEGSNPSRSDSRLCSIWLGIVRNRITDY
jgi:hypothetical protein